MSEKRLTGRIARENIKLMQLPRPPQGVVEGFLALAAGVEFPAGGQPAGVVDVDGLARGGDGAFAERGVFDG